MTKTGIDEASDDSSDDDDDKPRAPVSIFKIPATTAAAAAAPPPITESSAEIAAKKRANALAEVVEPEKGTAEIPILSSMDIKKLNGDGLKDALRERGLNTQGAKKDLIKRLVDHEASREQL